MRGKAIPKRVIEKDAVYGSLDVSKFINYIMIDGKKDIARKIVYGAIDELNNKTKSKGLDGFNKALDNIKPKVEVRSRRVGGSNFQVPTPVNPYRQFTLASRWLIEAARKARKNTNFDIALAQELISAFNKEGVAFKKREEVHRMAEANKAFAQFA